MLEKPLICLALGLLAHLVKDLLEVFDLLLSLVYVGPEHALPQHPRTAAVELVRTRRTGA